MVHVISSRDLAISGKKTQILSCMEAPKEQLKKKIYDSECLQRKINRAAKERIRLDAEIKKRYENIKHIDYVG